MTVSAWLRILTLVLLFFYTQWKVTQIFALRSAVSLAISFLVFVAMIAWMFVYRSKLFSLDSLVLKIIIISGSFVMALWTTFILFSFLTDIFVHGWSFVGKAFASTIFQPDRREFFTRSLSVGLLGLSGLTVGMGYRQAARGPKVKSIKLPARTPSALQGLKIVQISDLHVGLTIAKDYVQNVVQEVMSLKPDIIAVTGDLVDGTVDMLRDWVEPLKGLKAPHGVYFCTGNHEYYWGANQWIQMTKELGMTTLINENRIVQYNNVPLMIAGVADTSAEQFIPEHKSDAIKAARAEQNVAFKILLAHRPQSYVEAEKAGFDLQLSGHTHAGQFFPFNLVIPLVHKFYKGLNKHNDLWIYVNQGTGYWGPADRFAVPSEITMIEIV